MAEPGYSPLTLDKFGGLNTLVEATNLPTFMSPDCPDVEFVPGQVKTRPGTDLALTDPFPNASINYLKTFKLETINDDIRTLVVDSLGNFSQETVISAQGTLAAIYSGILPGVYCNSCTLFGREFMAMGDGKFGYDIPRQWNDQNFDRVSQVGPGAAPTAVDETGGGAGIVASPGGLTALVSTGNITAATQSGTTVTLTLAAPIICYTNTNIRVAGVTVAGYNGDFTAIAVDAEGNASVITYVAGVSGLAASSAGTVVPILAQVNLTGAFIIPSNFMFTIAGATNASWDGTYTAVGVVAGASTTSFQFIIPLSDLSLPASGGGTIVNVGNIAPGVHQVTVVFETRTGYLTKPAPPSSWTATGGKRVTVSRIPTGPPNVIARRLLFTAAGGDVFYSQNADTIIPSGDMRIPNNSTTTVTVDFSEASLLSSENFDYLFDLVELGEVSGFVSYNSRLVATGEQNHIQNFLNLSFDGGFTPLNGGFIPNANLPLGWTPDFYLGGHIAPEAVFGQAYEILGTGTAVNGRLYQSAYQDYLGNPILAQGTAYIIAGRFKKPTGITPNPAATVFVTLESVSGAFLYGIQANIGTAVFDDRWNIIEAGTPKLPTPLPSDIQLRVYASNLNVGDQVWIDDITVTPLANPVNQSIARVSLVEDPESYLGTSGFLQPSLGSGQALNSAFVIRNYLYLVKDKSLYVTADDGQNEPANWEIDEVSSQIGSPSPRGVGIGDEWAVIGSQSGLYLFQGGQISESNNLSREIRPTWDSIDWEHGYLLDIKVDTKRKRIYINAPLGLNSRMFLTLDYTEGFGDATGNGGVGRKWSIWFSGRNFNSQNLILRNDGSTQFMLGDGSTGSGSQTSTIFGLNPATLQDYNPTATTNPFAINGYWQSGYFKGDGRVNFGYIDANVTGIGTCFIVVRRGDQSWKTDIRAWILSSLGFNNMERRINIEGVRMALRLGTAAVGEYFNLQGLTVSAKQAPYAVERGINYASA